MKRFKRYLAALAGLVGLVSAILLATGWSSAVASNITGVFVTNSASNPVPVNGTVTLGGSPSIQLASGSTVSVGNTPSVRLDPSANTVGIDPTANVVDLASHLGQEYYVDLLAPMDNSFQGKASFEIPDGKAFVIQHVSADADVQIGQHAVLGATLEEVGGQQAHFEFFPLEKQSGSFGGLDSFDLDQDETLIAGPGTNSIDFTRDADTGNAFGRIVMSGYLVDAPA